MLIAMDGVRSNLSRHARVTTVRAPDFGHRILILEPPLSDAWLTDIYQDHHYIHEFL
jgi:hypothetical protein